ncbi:hypothetical protein K1719_042779 [Acacia pycnantha]|nr:hypothetical protein K1719_042779 [Acacia pycnantha]
MSTVVRHPKGAKKGAKSQVVKSGPNSKRQIKSIERNSQDMRKRVKKLSRDSRHGDLLMIMDKWADNGPKAILEDQVDIALKEIGDKRGLDMSSRDMGLDPIAMDHIVMDEEIGDLVVDCMVLETQFSEMT